MTDDRDRFSLSPIKPQTNQQRWFYGGLLFLLLAILIKFIVKKGKSPIDRDIDSIVFCPSEIPSHVIEEF